MNHPPVKSGYVRVYIDHTGRYYNDYTEAEMDEMAKDPLAMVLNEAIQEEIDSEIIKELKALMRP